MEKTEVRQEQIKRAVLDIIATEGLHSLSTRNLAKRVGISEGTIFRHFARKKDIIYSIMYDVDVNLQSRLRDIALGGQPPVKRLFDFLCTHVKFLLDNKGITILLFSEAAHMNDPDMKAHLHKILMEQKHFISKIIRDGIVEGVWDSGVKVDNAATLYMGIPITLNIELVLNPEGFKQENFCRNMMLLFERVLKRG